MLLSKEVLEGLYKKAGVGPFGFKAFRKCGPSVLDDEHNVSMKKPRRLLRHQSQRTTEIYLNRIDGDRAGVVKLLGKKTPKGTPPPSFSPPRFTPRPT